MLYRIKKKFKTPKKIVITQYLAKEFNGKMEIDLQSATTEELKHIHENICKEHIEKVGESKAEKEALKKEAEKEG